jgi:hypothetical protein
MYGEGNWCNRVKPSLQSGFCIAGAEQTRIADDAPLMGCLDHSEEKNRKGGAG